MKNALIITLIMAQIVAAILIMDFARTTRIGAEKAQSAQAFEIEQILAGN